MSLLEKRTFTEGQRKIKAVSQGGSQRNKYIEPTLLPLFHQLLQLPVNQTPLEASGLGDPDSGPQRPVIRGDSAGRTVRWSGGAPHAGGTDTTLSVPRFHAPNLPVGLVTGSPMLAWEYSSTHPI